MAEDFEKMSAAELLDYMGLDAAEWARVFVKLQSGKAVGQFGPLGPGEMVGWFANAIEAGRAAHYNRSIPFLAYQANMTAQEKGWWDSQRSFGEVIALIHSEASEALEEWRDNHSEDERYYSVAKYRPEPSGVPEEVRDIAAMLDRRGDGAYVAPGEMDDHEAETLVHAGFLKPEGVPAELADIFIRIADAASSYGIDLEAEIILKMAYNSTRPKKHGGKKA